MNAPLNASLTELACPPARIARSAAGLMLLAAFVVGTAIAGWVGVPVIALIWGVVARRRDMRYPGAVAVGIAAGGSWALLLAWTAARGPLFRLASTLGALVGVPGALLVIVTLLFPALLAWSAVTLVQGVGTRKERGRPE